ncbi:MAG: short-chain dehydrogenase [Halieaceae bacterium]|jgi:NAD(P)-dependent dehydrogenase (short-subunit alcohol dehydrogenase family)|nr:short-chain dehydrogenase [Halieaceae bacterium]|tara:strand:- start:13964 stop:14755 length:792 start_codon:yes stop_codon:yes gene_type:complete
MELRDKVVVVTGGASGIGAGLARRFCEEGVRGLVIADLNSEAAASLAVELGARSHGVDVRDESAIAALVADTEAEFGQIDLFCSNAGILNLDEGDYWATSSPNDVWQRNWEIHVMAHIYAARACLPSMIRRAEGHFLHTVSAAGLLNQPYTAAYATTKHAAIGFAESLAIAHGDDGIKVSCLCPQGVDTAMLGGSDGGAAGLDGILSPAQVAEATVVGLREEQFLILPHEQVQQYHLNKAQNYDRWIGGMRKLRRTMRPPTLP